MGNILTINATLNFWGSSNETKVKEAIFDFLDHAGKAYYDYYPFLLSTNTSDVAPNSVIRSLRS